MFASDISETKFLTPNIRPALVKITIEIDDKRVDIVCTTCVKSKRRIFAQDTLPVWRLGEFFILFFIKGFVCENISIRIASIGIKDWR